MSDTYVQQVEMVQDWWARFHCADATYEAFFEDCAWWLVFVPGDPSEGPFQSVEDVEYWLENDDDVAAELTNWGWER